MINRLEIPVLNREVVQTQPPRRDTQGKPFLAHIGQAATPQPSNLPAAQQVSLSTGEEPAMLELHLSQGNGVATMISIRWGLAANGRLSQSWTIGSDAVGTPTGWMPFVEEPRGDLIPANTSLLDGVETMQVKSEGDSVSATVVTRPATFSARLDVADMKSMTSLSGNEVAAEVAPWMQRLLRWFKSEKTDAVAWIRDYRLDERDAQELSAAVRRFAGEHGIPLKKIVLNSCVLWHANDMN
jgi:hypothetical protein